MQELCSMLDQINYPGYSTQRQSGGCRSSHRSLKCLALKEHLDLLRSSLQSVEWVLELGGAGYFEHSTARARPLTWRAMRSLARSTRPKFMSSNFSMSILLEIEFYF